MITKEEMEKVREFLNKAENPIFFYDDDPDGLASYLLLKKYIDKGIGIPIKSAPALDEIYLRKIKENSPDYVFLLDKPVVTQEFIDQVNVPLIYIDHHPLQELKGIKYFNPRKHNANDNRPTSYWCYQITKQNLWIAICGIVGDWYVPKIMKEFKKEYPDLVKETDDPGKLLFDTKLGELIKIFAFLLKGKVSDVKKNVRVLEKIETPYEILNKTTPKGKFIYKHFEKINKVYEKLLEKAKSAATKNKLLLFTYPSTKHSLTGALSNELLYNYPDKVIAIGREKEDVVIFSFRSQGVVLPPLIKKAMEGLEGHGGGHDYACGGGIKREDFNKFISNLKKLVSNV